MSIDLAALAATGRSVLDSLFATSATTITISRDADDTDATVDYTTLAVTDPTPASTVAAGVAAVIRAEANPQQSAGPERDVAPTQFVVLVPITLTDVADGDTITVTACPDARLVDGRLLVLAVADDGIGVVRKITARRI